MLFEVTTEVQRKYEPRMQLKAFRLLSGNALTGHGLDTPCTGNTGKGSHINIIIGHILMVVKGHI